MDFYKGLGSMVLRVFFWPSAMGFCLFYLEYRDVGGDLGTLFALVSLLIVMSASAHCPWPYKSEPDTSLSNIKRRAAGSVGASAVAAIMTFPDGTVQPSQVFDYGIVLGVLVLFSLGSVLLNFAALSNREVDRDDFLSSTVKALVGALITAIFLGKLQGLSAVQIFWLFVVVLGVFTNLDWPNNKQLAEAMAKAQPFERRVSRIVERSGFAIGVTAILVVATFDRERSLVDFLGTAMIIGLCHWLVTRDRDVYYGMQK